MKVKIGFFSDTHNSHGRGLLERLLLDADLDIAVFAGDMSGRGYKHEVTNFIHWFDSLPITHKVMIAGNHDFFFDNNWQAASHRGAARHHPNSATLEEIQEILPEDPNFHYLNDSGCEIFGIKFWGSPITPWFHDWAFNRLRVVEDGKKLSDEYMHEGEIYEGGNSIKPHWDLIPTDTDVLVTHGPPFGILDEVERLSSYEKTRHKGCEYLAYRLKEIKPLIHAFGHIHEAYGREEIDGTTYLNCSYLNLAYEPSNDPHIVELELPLPSRDKR